MMNSGANEMKRLYKKPALGLSAAKLQAVTAIVPTSIILKP
jgi:hypothetical protein